MEEISAAILKKSLDGLAMRFTYSAQNVANANSPGYQPIRVTFEESLRAATLQTVDAVNRVEIHAAATNVSGSDNAQRLDLELADASQTALRYRAMLDVLGRELALSRMIASGGGR